MIGRNTRDDKKSMVGNYINDFFDRLCSWNNFNKYRLENNRIILHKIGEQNCVLLAKTFNTLNKDKFHCFDYQYGVDVHTKSTMTIDISIKDNFNDINRKHINVSLSDFENVYHKTIDEQRENENIEYYRSKLISTIGEIKKHLPDCDKKESIKAIEKKAIIADGIQNLRSLCKDTLECVQVHRDTGCFVSIFNFFKKAASHTIFSKYFNDSFDIKSEKKAYTVVSKPFNVKKN